VPHFYRSSPEFVAAAEAAVSAAAPRQPVTLLTVEVDPGPGLRASPESAVAAIAEVLRHTLRADDHVGAVGAETGELVVVLAGASAEGGRSVGERICSVVRNHDFGEGIGRMTLSIGAAGAPEHGSALEVVLKTARAALERIKSEGRDGAASAPLPHHDALHRPLSIDRFAGRGEQLASLVRWLDEAAAGQPRVASIFGDAGMGTATLARQLEAEVRLRGGLFAMAASSNLEVREPYGVWRALLRATHRFPTVPQRDWQELPQLEPALGAVDKPAHTGSQYRLFAELTEYVRGLAQDRPLVLVLDEMQWADTTSWDALEYLLAALDADRIMLCLLHRPDAVYESSPQRTMLERHEFVHDMTISRLTRDEVKQWLEGAFHRQQVAREFLAFVYRHTEGNPLFIAELLRALIEDGAIWHSGARWEWSAVSELRVPAGRAALIARRLSKFSTSSQAVLATAAIIGREFDVGLLVAAGAGSEPAVRLAINEVLLAKLVRPTYERNRGGFAFSHDEIAEVLVDSLSRDALPPIHLRVAEALERRSPERTGEIALHFDAAGENAAAFRTAQAAAQAADRIYAHGAAWSYLQVAARNATTPAELAEVRVALAHVAETRGRHDEVEELCDLAIEWFEGQAESRRALTLRRMRERARMEQGQPARVTLDTLVALEAEAERLGFDRERVALLMMASQTHGRLGDQGTAGSLADECVAMAEQLGDEALLADALNRLANTVVAESPTRARSIYTRAVSLYEAAGDVRGLARCYSNVGIAAQFESKLEEAQQAFARGIAVARGAGIPDVWGLAALNLGVLCQKCGEYDRARELFGEALALFAAVKHSEYQLAALFNMAHVERELALWESASELYDATISLARRIGKSDVEIGAMSGAGLCYLELGRIQTAEQSGAAVAARVEGQPHWFQGREIAEALLIRLDVVAGRLDEAVRRFDRSVAIAESTDLYNAAWMTAICAESLLVADPLMVRNSIRRYASRVRELGYPEMTKRYEVLAAQ
jgi:tetratricopeptide (TPR) repeat protein